MSVPQITIALPSYEGLSTIPLTVGSLLAQDFGDFELVIFDDHSGPECREGLRELAALDSRIQLVLNPERFGAWGNFAHALYSVHQSRYFMWASQDDFWSPNWLSVLRSKLEDGPFGAAFGQVVIVDELGREVVTQLSNRRIFRYMMSDQKFVRTWRFALQPEYIGKGNAMYSLFRTDLLRGLGLFPQGGNIPLPYDFDIVRSFLQRHTIACSPEATFYKRVHSASNGQKAPEMLASGPASLFRYIEPALPRSLRQVVRNDRYWVDRYLTSVPRVGPVERLFLEAKLIRTVSRGVRDRLVN
jgi:hypothetical protein